MKTTRIHQLDNILANQIAAGEVVERPASVVKELIENSIDAGATRIEIEVEKGGAGLIRVKDDGSGIHPDDMTLALSRHATSKIQQTGDLAAITSLGFRGEALASISSVSKLDLISKWQQSEQALKAEAHGRDMNVTISPAGLNQGTLVEVRELFFNTPARRRFMRTDKTEFRNIDSVIARIALSHPHISFLLRHNGKKIRQFIVAKNRQSQEHRVGQILGKDFMQNCVHFSLQHEVESTAIQFSGWLGLPSHHRSMNDGQFVFINHRAVKDKVVAHAIREAYADVIPQGRLPAYIINIEMDAETVDVNVHPTKHEVRFQHQRMVHDLIIRAVAEVLSEANKQHQTDSDQNFTSVESKTNVFSDPHLSNKNNSENIYSSQTLAETAEVYKEFINSSQDESVDASWVVDNEYLILPIEGELLLISMAKYIHNCWPEMWLHKTQNSSLEISPILFPANFRLTQQQSELLIQERVNLNTLGLKFFIDEKNNITKLLTVPQFLVGIHSEKIIKITLENLASEKFIESFSNAMAKDETIWKSLINYHNLQNREQAVNWLGQQADTTAVDFVKLNATWLSVISGHMLQQVFNQSSH